MGWNELKYLYLYKIIWVEIFIFNKSKNPIDQNALFSKKVLTKMNNSEPHTSIHHLESICYKGSSVSELD